MRKRPLLAVLAAVSFSATFLCVASPASADADCSVVDLSPSNIVIGVNQTQKIQFDVGTDCDEDAAVSWYLTFRTIDQPGPWGHPLLANIPQPASSRYMYIEDGNYLWERAGNDEAGEREVVVGAFLGDDPAAEDVILPTSTQPFQILRRSTFGSSFNASPEPRRRGDTIRITGSLRVANWDTNTYEGVGEYVTLQFRPAGSDHYRDVKQVWNDGVSAKTTVKARTTGTWRYRFKGDGDFAPTNSKGDTVAVH
ncbi:MAG TPA: hypothetical protein VLL08_24695 [Kineosporiaceae bacterium]|nr:hypothetical protein [Kineosporiaceae bacterium]